MFKEKEYAEAISAKKQIAHLLENGYNIENISDIIYWNRWWSAEYSICKYAMWITALSLFTVNDNELFLSPSIEDILNNYHKVKRDISKRKPVYSTFVLYTNDVYTEEEFVKIRIA